MALSRPLARTLVTAGALSGLGAAFLAGASLGGPGGPGGPDAHTGPSRVGHQAFRAAYAGSDLSPAGSCEELLDRYVEQGVDLVGPYGWGYDRVYLDDVAGGPLPEVATGSAAGSAGGAARDLAAAGAPAPVRATSEETGTNVQEAGVDEPDVVKADATTLFRVEDGELVTYDLTGAEVVRLASLDLAGAGGPAPELLLSGDTVVVLGQDEVGTDRATTRVTTLDVSDPAAPEVTHTVDYDAGLLTARLHGGVVRLVLSAGLPDLDFVQPDRHTTDYEALEENRSVVRASDIGDWLPTVTYDDGDSEPLVACDRVALPDHRAGLGTVTVVGFDAPDADRPSVSGLAVDADLAYASADQLYLATTAPVGGPIPCLGCLPPIAMPDLDSVGRLLPEWLPGPRTGSEPAADDGASHVWAFDLVGTESRFAASGEVDGVIRDRWSMDAAGGVLRVAVGPSSATADANSILTLRQEGNDLVESGRLDHLGVGEEIKAVRWFDALAIVVTFRQVDPLYAVDLTDPDHPRLVGLLKVPGFSGYLHPLGRHRLLGLGEGPGSGEGWGAQAGLFDVSDLTEPRRLDVVSYGPGTTALATLDPRQLTWLPDRRTALSVVADYGKRGASGRVSVLTLGDGELENRMVEVEYGDEVAAVRLVPVPDGRVVLVTGDGASFFPL